MFLAFEGEILAPNALKKGDKVCILEPSRTTKDKEKIIKERLPDVIRNLEERGFIVVVYEESFTATPLGLDNGTGTAKSRFI